MNSWQAYRDAMRYSFDVIDQLPFIATEGRLIAVRGNLLEVEGCLLTVGQRCEIRSGIGRVIEAELIGFRDGRYLLMPLENCSGFSPGDAVIPVSVGDDIPVGDELLGRIMNGLAMPIDDKGIIQCFDRIPLRTKQINPLKRKFITEHLDVGVRSINGLLSVGQGQRMGIFAASGVGKSVLLGMMTRHTEADVTVVAMIGERGREVREFIEHVLGTEGLKKAVLIVSPADDAPLLRLRASLVAHRIAEYFRDRGAKVLLLMDSLTRFAQAQREVALSAGEPPSSRGFPPSAFSLMAQLLERAGNGVTEGSLTAFYTVLVEGDIQDDPVADSARAILDGHILLTRERAASGIYPAIDLTASISRSINQVISEEQLKAVNHFRRFYERCREIQELSNLGAYTAGSDQQMDRQLQLGTVLDRYFSQGLNEPCSFEKSRDQLETIVRTLQEDEKAYNKQVVRPS